MLLALLSRICSSRARLPIKQREPREQRILMAGDDGGTTTTAATLESTPTWAVATVCFCLISVSILIEHALHLLAKYLNKKRRRSLIHALNNVKSELMLLGFISLLLTVFENRIANICIPRSAVETFLPCKSLTESETEETKCQEQGKMSLMSTAGVAELQYLIFVLAFFHTLTCFLTFCLGMAKMRKWESWEAETRTLEYQFTNDPRRFRLIHQTSFGKRHLQYWSEHSLLRWPACFFQQFYPSVSRVDYLTLRHGFIMAHFAEGSNFDFQKYIKRALEKDFGVVVGVSLWIWIFSMLYVFFNARVFYNYLWLPFIPLVMLLLVGTKLQSIITQMCLDSQDKALVVKGTLLVRPSDHFFWFWKPKLLLHLMHFILFQNSFQLAFFTWTWFKFGLRSCFHEETENIVIRLVTGVLVQILCGYVTLPLYALVTQMGTSMRAIVFTEGVIEDLKRWRRRAKKNIAVRNNQSPRLSLDASLDTSPSFNTLDTLSLNADETSPPNSGYLAVEVIDEERVATEQPELHQKLGSFHGFDLSKRT